MFKREQDSQKKIFTVFNLFMFFFILFIENSIAQTEQFDDLKLKASDMQGYTLASEGSGKYGWGLFGYYSSNPPDALNYVPKAVSPSFPQHWMPTADYVPGEK